MGTSFLPNEGEIHRRSFYTSMLCIVFLATGCATIIRESTQNIPVQTAPAAVTVEMAEGLTYTTPTTLELACKEEYILEFPKEGYESSRIRISKHISGSIGIVRRRVHVPANAYGHYKV